MKGYTTRSISEILELPQDTIREYARSGVLGADKKELNGRYRFNFQDIIILRTAKELLAAGVRPGNIKNALGKVRKELPHDRSLTSLRISGEGGEVLLHDSETRYNPESGQMHFDFSIADLAGQVAPIMREPIEAPEVSIKYLTSDDWFDLGVDLEVVSPGDAPAAYRRALDLDPEHADAHVNLGRLLQEAGSYDQAEKHFQDALRAEPGHVLASFNLGTLYEDMDRIDDAIQAYQEAAVLADAHYNLSRLYELRGDKPKAIEHLKRYRELMDPGSS